MISIRSLLLLCVPAVLTVAGCTVDVDDPPSAAPTPDTATHTAVAVAGACDDGQLRDALVAWGADGFTGAVVVDGPDTACEVGVGLTGGETGEPITADSVFAIGSVSKAVVASAVLQLEVDGVLSRADAAGQYIDGLRGPAAEATIESLLLHTSGLVGAHGQDHVALSKPDAIAALSSLTLAETQPGEFLYSNAGYSLLALVLEEASQQSYRDLMVEQLLPDGAGFWDGEPTPTGERVAGFSGGEPASADGSFAGPHWALDGNGGIAMSARQLADWTRSAFTGDLLPPAAVAAMTEAVVDADGVGVPVGWARLDADVFGEVALGASGGGGATGHNLVVMWLPTSERVVVVASNDDEVTAEELLQEIGPAIVSGDAVPAPAGVTVAGAGDAAAAAGEYRLPSGDVIDVAVDDDGTLTVTPSGPDSFRALLTSDEPSDDVLDHEAAVAALLAGETGPGADEVANLEDVAGDLLDVDVLGTSDAGELRTYADLGFADGSVVGWYALNGGGGIEAVDLAGFPTVALVATGDGFRVDEGGDDTVVVTFDGDTMTVRRPNGTITAERAS